jgi:hypothetical protein
MADSASTGRMLFALTLVAFLVMGLGFAVVWAFSYGPL